MIRIPLCAALLSLMLVGCNDRDDVRPVPPARPTPPPARPDATTPAPTTPRTTPENNINNNQPGGVNQPGGANRPGVNDQPKANTPETGKDANRKDEK